MVIKQEHQLQVGILSNPTIPTVKTKTKHMYARGKANPKLFSTKSAALKQQIHCEAKTGYLSYHYPLYRTQRL
jgi:hypothetical protein